MQLKLRELQTVAKTTIKEEKSLNNLRDEMFRVLGPAVTLTGSHRYLVKCFNEHLDLLEGTGRFPRQGSFKLSTLLEVANSVHPDVRKLVARLLPEKHVVKFLGDNDSVVRCAAAKRLPHSLVQESVRRYPGDDALRLIAKNKRLQEAGLPDPKPVTDPFDMNGELMGDAAKGPKEEEHTVEWYKRIAHKLCSDYGANLEGQWEEALATRFSAGYAAVSNAKIDRQKLLDAIYDCIEEREEAILGEGSLFSLANRLRRGSYLEEAVMPIIEEDVNDPISSLVENRLSSRDYVKKAENVFGIKKSTVPAGIKKYLIGEGNNKETQIPVLGRLPQGVTFNSRVETVLDKYVDSWNTQQRMAGEPYKLSWSPHPGAINLIGFNMELK